jgi:hypothetical protein
MYMLAFADIPEHISLGEFARTIIRANPFRGGTSEVEYLAPVIFHRNKKSKSATSCRRGAGKDEGLFKSSTKGSCQLQKTY